MCSIAGINIKSEKIVKKMIDIQRHRAPDDEGYICFENLSLGMGRLEIIDLVQKVFVLIKKINLFCVIMVKYIIL